MISFLKQKPFWIPLSVFLLICIGVTAFVLLTPLSSPAIPNMQITPVSYPWTKYTNKQTGYEFEYPSNWQVEFLTFHSGYKKGSWRAYETLNPPEGIGQITIETRKDWFPYEDFIKNEISREEVTKIKNTKATTHNIEAISFVECEGGIKGGYPVGEIQRTLFKSSDRYFEISYVNTEAKEFEEIYQHVLSSFTLLNN